MLLSPGVVPLGLIFGATAAAAGFSSASAALFSLLVLAGATQFAAVALLETGAGLLAVTGLIIIMNARYLLLSAAALDIARRSQMSRAGRILLALGVVEESYALQAAWARQGRVATAGLLAIPATLVILWTASTWIGADLGARFPPLEAWGLDYALPGIFIGLLGIFAESRARLAAGLASLFGGGALALLGQTTLAILVIPPLVAIGFAHGIRSKSTQEAAQ